MGPGTSLPAPDFPAMPIFNWIITALWLLFMVYWAIAATRTKRTVKTTALWRHAAVRAAIILLALIAYRVPAIRQAVTAAHAHRAEGIAWGAAGTVLVGLGIGLAIVARAYLGRNWGTPMSRKENPELVTGGPYAFIRHPIYSGIILAMLGSMIAMSPLWVLPLVLLGVYFIYSARCEEELMCQQFPGPYQAYMARTKMLVPFLL
jgi:protein-S-isoprenylcysteine O-methyltransferase Ste14